MKASLFSLIALFGFAGVALADDAFVQQRKVIGSMIDVMEQITTTLQDVVDSKWAQEKRPELKKLTEDWLALRKRADGLRPPSKEEKAALVKEFADRMREAQKKLFIEIARVSIIDGGSEALTEVRSAFKPPDKKNHKDSK